MPPAPMAARCHLLGSSQESETLQYRQGVSTEDHHAHLVAFAAEVLARQAVAELVQDLGHAQRDARATARSRS